MKIYCLIASVILSFSSISQKSYYFSDPLPSVDAKIDHVDKKYYGTYKSKTGILSYIIDEAGISIISTTISSIAKEVIRESTQYNVRGGYIHGVVKNDSIPCVLEDDRYYFGIRNTDLFVGLGSENILTKTASSTIYYLNVFENGNYVPMQLVFKGGKMTINYFDYEFDATTFEFITDQKSIETEFQELIILNPSVAEFTLLLQEEIFDSGKVFKKRR